MFTLGRKVDPRIKTNLSLIISVTIISIIGWFFSNNLTTALYTGGVVFITWALSREVDPPHPPYAAFIALGISLINLFYINTIDTTHLLILFWLILILRMVSGIIGKELTLIDMTVVFALTTYLAINYDTISFLVILLLASGYLFKIGVQTRLMLPTSILVMVIVLIQALFMNGMTFDFSLLQEPLSLFLVASAAVSIFMFRSIAKRPCEDDQGKFANLSHIFAAQILYSITIVLMVFSIDLSIHDHIIHLAILYGSALHFTALRVIEK